MQAKNINLGWLNLGTKFNRRAIRFGAYGDPGAVTRSIMADNLRAGLASANRGNPFWTQSDAMRAFNEYRNQSMEAKQ